jgi:hypothetical protein
VSILTTDLQTAAIMSAGMKCLKEKLGVIETEIFVSTLKEDDFDYTEWRRDNLWPDMSCEEILSKAAEYERKHPRPKTRGEK